MGSIKKIKIFSKGTLTGLDWFIIISNFVCNLAYMLIADSFDMLALVAGVSGLLCVVLSARRSISTFVIGILNAATYAVVAYNANLLGEVVLNAFYYLPMQFVGCYSWMKHNGGINGSGEADESLVRTRRMTNRSRVVWAVISTLLVILLGWLLDKHTLDPQPYKDAFTTVLSVVAMYLMVRGYMEQWILWFFVNFVSTLMWLAILLQGELAAGFMVIMWIFYLIVTVSGWIEWSRALKAEQLR